MEDYFEGIFFRGNFLEEVFERNFSGEIFGFCLNAEGRKKEEFRSLEVRRKLIALKNNKTDF